MSTVLTLAPQTETVSSPTRQPAPRSGSPRRRTSADPGERRIWLILLGTLVLAAFCVGMFLQQPRFRHTDTPIGEIQLGANVPGSNPSEADDLTFGDSIDPDSWKMVRLTAQQGDGTLVEISLLRPDSWLAERNAVEGSVVDGLEFGRLGVVGDAIVETIAPCPPIRPGPGRTVTGIYRHFGQQVLDLRTANGEEIGVTPDHRFWSADRREFVQAGDLHPGETLNLLNGTTTVTSIRQRPSGEPVYTLEVHVEHVFHVAKSGVLVHNCNVPTRALSTFPKAQAFANRRLFSQHYKKHVVRNREWGDVISEKSYLARAKKLLSGPSGRDVSEYRRLNGDIVRFSKRTGEYGIVTQSGVIRTIFRPKPNVDKAITNGLDYFLKDRLKHLGF